MRVIEHVCETERRAFWDAYRRAVNRQRATNVIALALRRYYGG